jgi:hypothetical protein
MGFGNSRSRILAVVVAACLIATSGSLPAQAQDSWTPSFQEFEPSIQNAYDKGYHNVLIRDEASQNGSQGSYSLAPGSKSTPENLFACFDLGEDLDCGTGQRGFFSGSAILPPAKQQLKTASKKFGSIKAVRQWRHLLSRAWQARPALDIQLRECQLVPR